MQSIFLQLFAIFKGQSVTMMYSLVDPPPKKETEIIYYKLIISTVARVVFLIFTGFLILYPCARLS